MFVGQYQFTLDKKKRLVIPSKFRKFFPAEDKEAGIYVTLNQAEYNNIKSEYLAIYSVPAWEKHTEWITNAALQDERARWYSRKIASDTEFCKVDSQWRIVVPLRLINQAKLKRDIMITGVVDRIEVWDLAKWKEIDHWLKEHSTDFERSVFRKQT